MKRNRNGISLFLKRKIAFFETENHWPYPFYTNYDRPVVDHSSPTSSAQCQIQNQFKHLIHDSSTIGVGLCLLSIIINYLFVSVLLLYVTYVCRKIAQ